MRVRVSSVLLTLGTLAAGAALACVVLLYTGFYNVAATHSHLPLTYSVLNIGLVESIERHARDVAVPRLEDPRLAARGLALYRAHCLQCHGAPGVAPAPFALGMSPLPANLAYIAGERTPAELYWVVKHGVKMTGMPAWRFRLSEDDLWSVVAFVELLPVLSPAEYASWSTRIPKLEPSAADPPAGVATASADRGKVALRQYACTTCHLIPDIVGAYAPVGPPLERIATREYLAGVIPNTPENMVRWLRFPQKIDPLTAMPDLGVTERDARDIAAYLYTLD